MKYNKKREELENYEGCHPKLVSGSKKYVLIYRVIARGTGIKSNTSKTLNNTKLDCSKKIPFFLEGFIDDENSIVSTICLYYF